MQQLQQQQQQHTRSTRQPTAAAARHQSASGAVWRGRVPAVGQQPAAGVGAANRECVWLATLVAWSSVWPVC
jgi:hypothetical protein